MQELYALAEALRPFDLLPGKVAAVGVACGLDTVRIMKLVMLVCGRNLVQAKSAATEALHGITLSEHQGNLFKEFLDDTEE